MLILWYYDLFSVPEVHDSGLRVPGVRWSVDVHVFSSF